MTKNSQSSLHGGTEIARSEQDIQADVNVILDTLLTTHAFVERIVAAPEWPGGVAPVVDFALDAVKRLRKDALRG